MATIRIENIRSFQGQHSFEILPITILVGENSSGKTTLIASLAAISNASVFPGTPALNSSPFTFGGFDAIANRSGDRQAKKFMLGYRSQAPGTGAQNANEATAYDLEATYRNEGGRPSLWKLRLKAPDIDLEFKHLMTKDEVAIKATFEAGRRSGKRQRTSMSFRDQTSVPLAGMGMSALANYLGNLMRRAEMREEPPGQGEVFRASLARSMDATLHLYDFVSNAESVWGEVRTLAPIRTRPHRTYDIAEDLFDPEGQHIPYRLRQSDARGANSLLSHIAEFGKMSGLFDRIVIKRLGRSAASPFQMLIDMEGLAVNLADVGYGVSQSLPVVVEALLTPLHGTLLVQQPEVHLHPKGQAALGSLFARLIAESKHRTFVLETHSDYLVGRIRQEIAKRTIKPEQVGLYWVERAATGSSLTRIQLDAVGNVTDAPPGYRRFFLEEQRRMLERGS